MSKFFLHVRRGDTVFEDRKGLDVRDVTDAVRAAVHDARQIVANEPEVLPTGQWMEVTDDQGNTVRTLRFETIV
ncbi:MAG: hypothetical protein ABL879_10820 [Devosia sp.]